MKLMKLSSEWARNSLIDGIRWSWCDQVDKENEKRSQQEEGSNRENAQIKRENERKREKMRVRDPNGKQTSGWQSTSSGVGQSHPISSIGSGHQQAVKTQSASWLQLALSVMAVIHSILESFKCGKCPLPRPIPTWNGLISWCFALGAVSSTVSDSVDRWRWWGASSLAR